MVATSVGPGASAPLRPITKPSRTIWGMSYMGRSGFCRERLYRLVLTRGDNMNSMHGTVARLNSPCRNTMLYFLSRAI